MYVLVLGLDVLGNPFGLIRGLSEGVEAFFYEPYQVILSCLFQPLLSFISHTFLRCLTLWACSKCRLSGLQHVSELCHGRLNFVEILLTGFIDPIGVLAACVPRCSTGSHPGPRGICRRHGPWREGTGGGCSG